MTPRHPVAAQSLPSQAAPGPGAANGYSQAEGGPAASAPGPALAGDRGFQYSPASGASRFLAGTTDALAGAVLGLLLFIVLGRPAGGAGAAVFLALWQALALVGLTVAIGLFAQTPGQWFWGLMVVRPAGAPVPFLRAFLFALATVCLGVLTPLTAFLVPGRRAPNDLLCGVLVIRTRILYQ